MTEQVKKPEKPTASKPKKEVSASFPDGLVSNEMYWLTVSEVKHGDITAITELAQAGEKGTIQRDTVIIPGQAPSVTTVFLPFVSFRPVDEKDEKGKVVKTKIVLKGGTASGIWAGFWRTGGINNERK